MKISEIVQKDLANLRIRVIDEIEELVTKAEAYEIHLDNPVMFQYIDEQISEVICNVRPCNESVTIDTGENEYELPIKDLSLDLLVVILEEVENGHFSVWEDICEG